MVLGLLFSLFWLGSFFGILPLFSFCWELFLSLFWLFSSGFVCSPLFSFFGLFSSICGFLFLFSFEVKLFFDLLFFTFLSKLSLFITYEVEIKILLTNK
ncbi:hypothetical protein ACJA27_00290 [Mycoplasmopsis lipophila]|uniref:hypothetical protein n=1 Tax=Mycoplasmopsis lipophila TaxID=2117 RepID=UPI003872F4C7